MRDVNLGKVDLNLLRPLHALLEEKQVTRAAKRCYLSQPAMSHALERLRDMFGDPLLVRSGRGYERTVQAERLLRELDSLLPRLEAAMRGAEFDPSQTRERFRVAMTDNSFLILMPKVISRMRRAAPNASLEISAWRTEAYADVVAGRLDLALTAEVPPPELRAEVLYKEKFVCLVSRAGGMRSRRFSLKEYLDLPHAVVATWEGQQAPVDRPLAQLGLRRNVVVRIPFFVSTIFAVAGSDLVLTVTYRLAKIAAAIADVRTMEAPAEIEGFSYLLAWHPRLDAEPARAWFREQLREVAKRI
jgi:DNA-binding transcriptional LysR family regulator